MTSEKMNNETPLITGLELIGNTNPKILILGTFPGKKSLEQQQYYANRRNLFWECMARICSVENNQEYEDWVRILEERDICVWDVLKSCSREGSLDQRIRNGKINDFKTFLAHSNVKAIFFNGRTAEKLFVRRVVPELDVLPPTMEYLPSTSPANAGMTEDEKLSAWRKVKQFRK